MPLQNKFVLLVALALPGLGCGSLIGETDRIRMLYEQQNGTAVIATDPADNTIAPHNQTYIDVTFSNSVDAGTVTAQSTFGACSGSLQVSYDGFINCLPGTIDAAANPRIRFTPTIFPKGLTLQVRILSAVLSVPGVAATPYTSPNGFKLGAPCGNENCFFSYSTPLMTNAGTANGVFLIRTGENAGKYLVYSQGTVTTTLIDLLAVQSTQGPNFCSPSVGSYAVNFYAANSGNQIVVHSGSANTCVYDSATSQFVTGSAFGATLGAGAHAFPSASNNDIFIVQGSPSQNVYRYDGSTGTIAGPYNLGFPVGDGSHSVRTVNGSNPGKHLIFAGGGSTSARFMDATGTMSTTVTTAQAVNGGALSIESYLSTGKLVTAVGNNTVATSKCDLAVPCSSTLGVALEQLNNPINPGALLLRHPNTSTMDKPLIISSGTLMGGVKTNFFDSANLTFSLGPPVTGKVTQGAASIYAAGTNAHQAFLVINGNGSAATSVYFAASNRFHGSRMPGTVPNLGANYFVITAGGQTGKTLIVSGNGVQDTAIFDPLKFEMFAGPPLQLAGSTTSFNMPLTQGGNAGKVLVFVGAGGSTFNLYNPGTNLFSVPGGFPTFSNMGAGAVTFPILKANDKRIVMLPGGGSTTADTYDQETNAFVQGIVPAPPCAPNVTPFTLRFTKFSTGEIRQFVYCSANQVAVFDHNTASFLVSAGSLTGASAGPGIQAFVLPQGANAGKIFVVHGNGQTNTSLFDPETNTSAVGPALTLCGLSAAEVDAGSQLLPITTGFNAGKFLLIAGNSTGSVKTCLIDATGTSLVAGNPISTTPSAGFKITNGSLAFKTNGGLYPTSFVILSGATKNVWSTYVP